MNWVNIVKEGPKEFIVEKKEEVKEVIEEIKEIDIFKDPEQEFDYKYSEQILDIKIAFQKHLSNYCLPFLDNINNLQYNLYDYIKQHCVQYNKVCEMVKLDNKIIQDELDAEQKEIEEELAEEEELFDD